jgi:hypothetical protein
VHRKEDLQYKPGKAGKGTLKYIVTINTESFMETNQALMAAGFPGINPTLEFKQCLSKQEIRMLTQTPKMII